MQHYIHGHIVYLELGLLLQGISRTDNRRSCHDTKIAICSKALLVNAHPSNCCPFVCNDCLENSEEKLTNNYMYSLKCIWLFQNVYLSRITVYNILIPVPVASSIAKSWILRIIHKQDRAVTMPLNFQNLQKK